MLSIAELQAACPSYARVVYSAVSMEWSLRQCIEHVRTSTGRVSTLELVSDKGVAHSLSFIFSRLATQKKNGTQ